MGHSDIHSNDVAGAEMTKGPSLIQRHPVVDYGYRSREDVVRQVPEVG